MKLRQLARKCGRCDACCTALGIVELKKPPGEACANLRAGGGCGCYENRPPSCRDWHCEWVAARVGTEDDRPDRIGGFFWRDRGTRLGELMILEANAVGSLTPRAIALAEQVASARLVYIKNGREGEPGATRRVIGPPAELARVTAFMSKLPPGSVDIGAAAAQ